MTSTSQYLVIINNHPKVVHPRRFSSPRLTFERQTLSFCILWCITNFPITPCTAPVFNYHFERLRVFGGLYMVREGRLFQTWLCTGIFKFNIYFSRTSLLVSGLRLLIVYRFRYTVFLIYLHSLLLCLILVATLHRKSHNRYRETLEPFFEGFQFSLAIRHSKTSKLTDSN